MKKLAKRLTVVFSAGCFGGLVNSLTFWLLEVHGVIEALGVKMTPRLTAPWLYPRVVWGGLWGFLFVLPLLRGSYLLRGIVLSAGPSLVQLFVLFPTITRKGLMGLDLGYMTPVLVVFLNAVWGICTVLWLRFIDERA